MEDMKIDTAGNKINELISNCDCGLTGGCKKCNLFLWKIHKKWSMLDEIPITEKDYDYYENLDDKNLL